MAFQSFQDLDVWQRGCRLAVEVFRTFADCRNFTMQDQIQRAALSIPSKVAEGYERNSDKEFIRFLNIAKRSGGSNSTLDIAKAETCNQTRFRPLDRRSKANLSNAARSFAGSGEANQQEAQRFKCENI